jgi:hypothetical protein
VDEHVLPASIGLDEAETLRRVEPFDRAGRHSCLLVGIASMTAVVAEGNRPATILCF